MSRTATFMGCTRCEGNIYLKRAIQWDRKWFCKHCAKALKII